MTHGSLFSGIGGFDLAAEWAGWENKFHCEWNEFGKRVLNYYWPKAESYGDITKTDFTIWRGRIDILTGGFPCQPYSTAGKRLGKADERHLWPEMLRAIREIQPRYIVGENVYGLINWNGGLVFNEVQTDLEAIGYKVQPVVLPACAVNAPHRRDRIWFVAYNNNGNRQEVGFQTGRKINVDSSKGNEINSNTECEGLQKPEQSEQHIELLNVERNDTQNAITDTTSKRYSKSGTRNKEFQTQIRPGLHGRNSIAFGRCGDWENFPTQSPICNGDDGFSTRLDGITFPKWRTESIKAGGNAIVPQVVYQIFKAINQYEQLP